MEQVQSSEAHVARLADIGEVLALYYKMWAGRPCRFGSDHDRLGLSWEDIAALPDKWLGFDNASRNKDWYFIATTHRAAHIEFHTFDLAIPPELEARFKTLAPTASVGNLSVETSRNVLELLASKDSRRSGLYAVVRTLEDFRVDQRLKNAYPGLTGPLSFVQRSEARLQRFQGEGMPPRSRFARMIAAMGLEGLESDPELPDILHEPYRSLVRARARLESVRSSVLDSIALGIWLWADLLRLPNVEGVYASASRVTLEPLDAPGGPIGDEGESFKLEDVPHLEGSEVLAIEVPGASYRDDLSVDSSTGSFGLPLADALMVFEALHGTGSPFSLDEQDLLLEPREHDRPMPWEVPPDPLPHEHTHDEGDQFHLDHGELGRRDPSDFLYPEWDFFAKRYRANWVRVHEMTAAGASKLSNESRAEASVGAYVSVCRKLRSQLESIFPSGHSRVAGFPWGDDINLDAGIQMLVDRRSGSAVDDRVYEVQIHNRRDVVVALLLDISCSTAERQAPVDQFVEHADLGWVPRTLTWSESRSPAIAAKGYRTLLDIEIEMAAVLSSVMNNIGDGFGLYAFSGSGRGEVSFQILKDADERFGPIVYRRLDSLRPIHATRMGAAIRHATKKLARWESKTKILILLSDGRPFDVDYGPPDDMGHTAYEPEYARGDTVRAVEECQRQNVRFGAILTGSETDALSLSSGGTFWARCEDVDELSRGVASLFGRLIDVEKWEGALV